MVGEVAKGNKKDYNQMIYAMERIWCICSFGHGRGSCLSRRAMGVKVPERAEYIRTILHELSRVHSHMLCCTWLMVSDFRKSVQSLLEIERNRAGFI